VTDEDRDVLELAVRLAREAGALQRERWRTRLRISTKSTATDLVTEVDHACERLVVEALRRERPGDAIVAEEGSGEDRPDAPFRWIIDPLDGTVNFAHGYPRFCVSIGVEAGGERALGVVYDPILDELFHAVRGAGAFVNGERIHVSAERELGRALLATGFAYDPRGREENLVHFAAFMNRTRGLRRDGSAALDLSYVACGRLDGFWELHLHAWDVAAGFLLVEEAGGRVSDLAGRPPSRSGAQTVASNGGIHDAMLAVLRGRA
jgi:myo-inositol-1(or 4)-monophosphatase